MSIQIIDDMTDRAIAAGEYDLAEALQKLRWQVLKMEATQ